MASQFELESTGTKDDTVSITIAELNKFNAEQKKAEKGTEKPVIEVSDEEVANLIEVGKVEIDSWLEFKVKNELVKQIYSTLGEGVKINIETVKEVIADELDSEEAKNTESEERMLIDIPNAEINRSSKGYHDYMYRDANILKARRNQYGALIDHIQDIKATGEEGLYSLAEEYIKRTELKARDEVITILLEQRNTLQRTVESAETSKTPEIEEDIEALKAKITSLEKQLADRDMQLLDKELDEDILAASRSVVES